MHVKDIDMALQVVSRTFLAHTSFNTHPMVKNILELSAEIRNIIKILSCIPTDVRMLKFLPLRLEAAKKAGIQETDSHFIAIKEIDTREEKTLEKFDDLKEKFNQEIKEKTLVLLGVLEQIKRELDPQIRADLLRMVIPSMRLAIELFINNLIYDGSETGTRISSENMNSILEVKGKPQIVSTRKYIPISYMQYMAACVTPSVLKGAPPSYDVMVKAVVSKESGLVYLSTFFPESSKK